jgi:hypothetical protein
VKLCLTLTEEHRLRVLRIIFGPKKEEATGDWRRLHNVELHNVYASPNVVRMRLRQVGHLARMEEMRNAYNILVGKAEGRDHVQEEGIDGRIISE